MHRRAFAFGVGAALVAPRLAAPAIAQGAQVLRVIPLSNLTSPDPIWTTSYAARNHGYFVWDTLFSTDAAGEIRPQMAGAHEITDGGATHRIRLREGLRFHDGTPVLARDCAASISRWMRRDSFGQALGAATDAVEAEDDVTLRFRLKRPFPRLAQALGKPSANVPFIMPQRIAETDPFRAIALDQVVGSGPFRFVADEFRPGARVVYARFDGYTPRDEQPSGLAGGKRVLLDRVEWTVLPDPATAAAALQRGEMDVWEEPIADLLPVLRRNQSIRVEVMNPSGMVAFLRFNQLHPPFDNPVLRRAVLTALDQNDYLAAMTGAEADLRRDCSSFFACSTPTAPRRADMAAGRRMVREAGADGQRVIVLTPTDNAMLNAAGQVTEQRLRDLGFVVDYRAVDFGTMVRMRSSREPGAWHVFHSNLAGPDIADPAVSPVIRGNGADALAGWPTDPRLESLRDAWLAAGSPGEAGDLLRQIEQQAAESVPFVPLGQYFTVMAWRSNVTGIPRAVVPVYWNTSVRRA